MQAEWRWCHKCQVLAFTEQGAGICAAAGRHDHSQSGDYALAFSDETTTIASFCS
jgi:hypothetical protein